MLNEDSKELFTTVSSDGYDKNEVESYIARLQSELIKYKDAMSDVPPDFLAEHETMRTELASYREIEGKLKEALQAAHKATENIQQIVENESRRILFEANKNADDIIAAALDQSITSLKYIKKMRMDARVFQKRFEVFIAAQNEFIDETIWDEILAPIDAYEFMNITSIEDIEDYDEKNEEEKE
jgi:cell division septum initiation protein DivIVA